MANKEVKKPAKKPAGKYDNLEVTYANFAASKDKQELKIDGKKFDNNELLKTLGFKEKDGVMILATANNEVIIDEFGKVIERTELNYHLQKEDNKKKNVIEHQKD